MTTDHAKFILQAFREGQDISGSPEMKEAVGLMNDDAELQTWYHNEFIFDQAFAAKLDGLKIPADLDRKIIAQVKVKPNAGFEFPWWKQFSVLGAAASFLLILGIVLLPNHTPSSYPKLATSVEHFQDFAARSLKTNSGFNARSPEWKTLVSYLNDNKTPAPTSLPDKMNVMPSVGCMTLQYHKKPVGVICFGKNGKSHLFVINFKDFPEMPIKESPVVEENAYTTSIYWSGEDRHYLLVSNDAKELKQFVSF